jgi:hypothetical protein
MRTFIFGAGGSAHAGYPITNSMWPAMASWALESCPPESMFRGVVEEMKARFDVSRPFELVLTDLDDRIAVLIGRAHSDREKLEKFTLLEMRRTLGYMICCYFNAVRSQPARLYERFASEVLEPGDAVITFNYDVALDRSMRRSGKWTIRDGYGFEIERLPLEHSPCRLLKLHGSTNWRGELFGGMEGFGQWNGPSLGERPVIDRVEFEYLGYDGLSDTRCHNGRVRIDSLIMPGAKKQFYIDTSLGREWSEFWDSLWYQAEDALRMSDEIYIVGYSLPEYDARARDLLAKGIQEDARVNVCCHTATRGVVESLKQIGLVAAVSCEAATFEEFLSGRRKAAGVTR